MPNKQPHFCFLDFDIDGYRNKLNIAASFVDATDTRYGFTSKDLRNLGGSELARIEDLISTDHEWSSRCAEIGGIQVRPPVAGNRIVVKLNWDVAPLACENFSALCRNGDLGTQKNPIGESGKPLSYKDSVVHRIVPGFVMQGGDFVFGNGSGGESIFGGKKFKDERPGLALKHDRRGILSMGNSGKNSNTSQFFFTFGPVPQCDGKHVIFGEIVSGWEVLAAAETAGTKSGEPSVPVAITACGIYEPLATPAAGYWFDQPDDSYFGSSPVFMCRPRVLVLAPTMDVCRKFEKSLTSIATLTLIASNDYGNSSNPTTNHVETMLERFAIDVVLIAPTCKADAPSSLPANWAECAVNGMTLEKVVVLSKPLGCAAALKKSWVSNCTWNLAE